MAESNKKAATQELYKIHSTVRSVSTRLKRATSPTRHRFTMFLGGGLVRVIRKRPSVVTRDVLTKLIPELLDKESKGMLMVTDVLGQRIDLKTMAVTSGTRVESPLPKPPLDTAAKDSSYAIGEDKSALPGGVPETKELKAPAVTKRDLPEGKDEDHPGKSEDHSHDPSKPALLNDDSKSRRRGRRRV